MDLLNLTTEELENEIKSVEDSFKSLHEFSDEDKIKFFDRQYQDSLNYVIHFKTHGFEPKDFKEYLFEDVMASTLGVNCFDIINK